MEYSLSAKNFNIKRVIKTVTIIVGLFLIVVLISGIIFFISIRLDEKSTREAMCKGAVNESECLTESF